MATDDSSTTAGAALRAPTAPEELAGRWYIVASNFPMWAHPARSAPTFDYTPEAGGLRDEVCYQQAGRTRRILGFDTPVAGEAGAFVWRGRGLLALVTSRWRVALLAEAPSVGVVTFQATWFTPAGTDLIARTPDPSAALLAQLRAAVDLDPARAALAEGLRPVRQGG